MEIKPNLMNAIWGQTLIIPAHMLATWLKRVIWNNMDFDVSLEC